MVAATNRHGELKLLFMPSTGSNWDCSSLHAYMVTGCNGNLHYPLVAGMVIVQPGTLTDRHLVHSHPDRKHCF